MATNFSKSHPGIPLGGGEERDIERKAEQPSKSKNGSSLESIARNAHKLAREDDSGCFSRYGISSDSINNFMLGIKEHDGHYRLTIPIFDREGKVAYIRLLRAPDDEAADTIAEVMGKESLIPKFATYPANAEPLLVGEDQLMRSTSSNVLICGNELDRIIAIQERVKMPVVTSGGNIEDLKDEWIGLLRNIRNIYIYDDSGNNGIEKMAQRLTKHIPAASVYIISVPLEDGVHANLTDYFIGEHGTVEELFTKYAKFYCGVEPIDVSQFKELTVGDIAEVLDSTIKHDFVSKVITFLVMLLAYTGSDQQNVMFNADSSSGKTYICLEVSKYFPQQDVLRYGKTTPTAFYYSPSLKEKDAETGQSFINLERRILIFTEQPDTQLQENLRSLLSHDSKRVPFAITNKSGGKNVAMEGYILGFPSAFFCSANMRIDEQEQTRCLILSPENSPEKIMAGIDASITKNSNNDAYENQIKSDPSRRQLMERILYIKELNVSSIDIDDSDYLKTRFMENQGALRPKAQREISHFISLVKAMALVNAPFRMKGDKLVATNKDVDEAMKLWTPLRESMLHGVSPQILSFYRKYVLAAYRAKNEGVTTKAKGVTYDEIRAEYYRQTGSFPNMENMRKQYIPALKTAALISCNKDEDDKRQIVVTPLVFFEDDIDK